MTDVQKQVQQAIDEVVESGSERGLQVAVYHHGEQVVDAVAGIADAETGRPVTAATPFYTFSVGKAAAATIAHILAERGMFTYDTPVVELWPEFGARGKQGVTVRHVLTHSAGVPGIPLDTTIEDLCDWDKMCASIADAELWWEPGTQVGYHAYTFGYIVGEIVRRATGRRISQLLREEIAEPLGVGEELYFGMPRAEQGRLARLEDAPSDWDMSQMPPDLPMFKAGPMHTFPTAEMGNRADVLAADIPAGGKNTARAVARMYAAVIGEVDGVRLIPAERFREASTVSSQGVDAVFGNPSKWGLGYSIGTVGEPDPAPGAIAMGGVGGSFAFGDADSGVALGLSKNTLAGDFNAATTITEIVMRALGATSQR